MATLDSGELLKSATAPQASTVSLPRSLLVFAHCDDEVIALGGRMGRFGQAHLLHVTDSAPRNGQDANAHGFDSVEAYRRARETELQAALELAGIADISHECLGCADQEAALALVSATREIAERIARYRPEVVITHPFEGGHPDHDACAFAVHHAVRMQAERTGAAAEIIEAASYHLGPDGMVTGSFLPHNDTASIEYRLEPEEQERKCALFACFRSQQNVLHSFGTEWERFRIAPRYNFAEAPHVPPLLYDQFPWGMTSARFAELARDAEAALQAVEVAAGC